MLGDCCAAAGIMAVLIAVACCKRSGDLSEQEEAGEQEPPACPEWVDHSGRELQRYPIPQ